MMSAITRRLRLFLKSELDLHKDRLIEELRGDEGIPGGIRAQELELEKRLNALAQSKGLTLAQVKREFLLQGVRLINTLVFHHEAKLNLLDDGRLEIQIGTAKFIPDTLQELGILKEVFDDEVYLIETNQPMYVWDVGANVATASIYFASVLGWEVSAYELFPPTAQVAQRNIERSGLTDKVHLNVMGVGGRAETLTLPYNERSRGSNGLFGNTDPGVIGEGTPIEVQVADASDEFKKVETLAAGRPIYAKFDCEGAEYDIIPRLIETGEIRKLAAIAMEEHLIEGKNREALVIAIRDAGFFVRRTRRMDKHVAMLYAFRQEIKP